VEIHRTDFGLGPNMWPNEELLQGFRDTIEKYMSMMGGVAEKFTSLVAEAIGLAPEAFDQFFEPKNGPWPQQHKLKIVKYPDIADLPPGATTQGVGPHKGIPYHLLSQSPFSSPCSSFHSRLTII
jgi:isopenicillin N synthase-like dioxygenase